ncbi:MAG: hypothetical protein IPI77_24390 [Saprospiraceae bacterium]|nr:hypothetical protein [Saprospiraceae bacterium]
MFGVELGSKIKLGNNQIKCSIQIENLLDTTYRDYLNRQRYFADETGRNIKFRINYIFIMEKTLSY